MLKILRVTEKIAALTKLNFAPTSDIMKEAYFKPVFDAIGLFCLIIKLSCVPENECVLKYCGRSNCTHEKLFSTIRKGLLLYCLFYQFSQ